MTSSPTSPHVGLVVEGPGDAKALPLLLRNWLQARADYRDILGKAIPCHGRDKATLSNGIEGFVATAAARPGCRGILVVLDGEGDAVCELGPSLRERAALVSRVPVEVALADHCYEDWLHASIETLGLTATNYRPDARGTGSISEAVKPSKYVKPTWQPRLTARMDLTLAAGRNQSLARMLARFDQMVSAYLT